VVKRRAPSAREAAPGGVFGPGDDRVSQGKPPMSPGGGKRRRVALYPDVALLARAYDGIASGMAFVDPTHVGPEYGTATFPVRSLSTAHAAAPVGWTLLLAATTHHLPVGFAFTSPRILHAAQGGAPIVAP
jgi:hypothetical protein